jgi:hypothetical protein
MSAILSRWLMINGGVVSDGMGLLCVRDRLGEGGERALSICDVVSAEMGQSISVVWGGDLKSERDERTIVGELGEVEVDLGGDGGLPLFVSVVPSRDLLDV